MLTFLGISGFTLYQMWVSVRPVVSPGDQIRSIGMPLSQSLPLGEQLTSISNREKVVSMSRCLESELSFNSN